MKKTFFTGLIILLPITITFLLIRLLINFITTPFEEFTRDLLSHAKFLNAATHPQLLHMITIFLIIVAVVGFLILIGAVTRLFIFRSLLHLSDAVLRKTPFVNRVYTACKDFTDVLFTPKDTGSFSKVVLFRFPHQATVSVGLVTAEFTSTINGEEKEYASILIPGVPNPITGFALILPKNEIIYTSMTVEEALRCAMTCGASTPDRFHKEPIICDL